MLPRKNGRMSTSTERMRRLRERRAAGLLPAEGQAPRDAADLLAPAVEESTGRSGDRARLAGPLPALRAVGHPYEFGGRDERLVRG
jgi:hypothetical protein